MSTTPYNKFMSPKEAALELGVSKATILASVRSGELPSVKLNARTIRIPRSAVEVQS